jgi:hypothetical protein
LISFWNNPVVEAKKAVIHPIIVIKFKTNSDLSKRVEHLVTKKTPAVT